jgi:hypothetical protein
MTSHFSYRTDQKLAFARIHLGELQSYRRAGSNDDWENAHQESCLFHLAGAVDAMLQEINDAYSLGLTMYEVTWKKMRTKFRQTGQSSPAFAQLDSLRQNTGSSLALLYALRNHGAHRTRVAKLVSIGNVVRVPDNEFKDPRTEERQSVYPGLGCTDVLARLHKDVQNLVSLCRRSDPRLAKYAAV